MMNDGARNKFRSSPRKRGPRAAGRSACELGPGFPLARERTEYDVPSAANSLSLSHPNSGLPEFGWERDRKHSDATHLSPFVPAKAGTQFFCQIAGFPLARE